MTNFRSWEGISVVELFNIHRALGVKTIIFPKTQRKTHSNSEHKCTNADLK